MQALLCGSGSEGLEDAAIGLAVEPVVFPIVSDIVSEGSDDEAKFVRIVQADVLESWLAQHEADMLSSVRAVQVIMVADLSGVAIVNFLNKVEELWHIDGIF